MESQVKQQQDANEWAAEMLGEPAPEIPEEQPQEASSAPEGDEIDESEGVDASEEENASEDEVQEDEFKYVDIEIDGKVLQVPEEYKDYFMRQADYTQKTQTLAEQRRQVELQQKQIETVRNEQKFVQEIQPELNNIGYLDAHIQQYTEELQTKAANLSSEELFRKKIELDGLKEQRAALAQGLQSKYKEFEEAQKQSYQELLEQGAQALKKVIPNWSEEKQKEVRDFALSKGFSQQEVSSIVDPRHVEILYKASQYEALQGKRGDAVKAVSKTVTPKARTPRQTQSDKKLALRNQLKNKNLSDKAKANLIGDNLADWLIGK